MPHSDIIKEGQIDPNLGKKIEVLIEHTSSHLVYLDDQFDCQWYTTTTSTPWPDHAGAILNRVSRLEAISGFLRPHSQFRSIRCMIAEGVARLLDGNSLSDISSVLDDAEREVLLRNREYSRRWFFCSVSVATLIAIMILTLLFFLRGRWPQFLSEKAFEVLSITFAGAIGALASTCIRSEKIELDANAGLSLHIIEGVARVTVGIIAALLLSLFIKGGILLHSLEISDDHLSLVLGLGIIAGASEQILPGFIKKGESLVIDRQSNKERKSDLT